MKFNFIDKFYYEYLSLFSTAVKTVRRNLKEEKFEPEVKLLSKVVSCGDICIDVGGAYGRYALPLSKIVGSTGKIFSFEPGRYSYRVLSIVKWFHGLKNVSICNSALSNKKGLIKLCLPIKKTGKIGPSLAFISIENQENTICELVKVTTIDNFCTENNIIQVNFIKCDTEGSEFLVFRGAVDIIKKCRPIILSEVDALAMSRYGYQPSDLEEFFRAFAYKIFSYRNEILGSNEKIIENGNYFFIPEEKMSKIGQI